MREKTSSTTAGFVAMVTAMMLLPCVDALSKYVTSMHSADQIAWFRNATHAAIIMPLALVLHGRRSVLQALNWSQFIRSVAFVAMTAVFIAALRHLPLADALAIIFLYPLFITIAAGMFLGERIGAYRWLAVVAGIVGVCLVVRPGFAPLNAGTPWAFAAMLLAVVYLLLTRHMSGTAPDLVLLAWPACIGTVLISPLAATSWSTPSTGTLGLMLLIGALAALVHLLIIVAYTRAEASAVAPLAYLQIVVGAVLGYLVFGDVPDGWSWTGIVLIIGAGLVTMWREQRQVEKG